MTTLEKILEVLNDVKYTLTICNVSKPHPGDIEDLVKLQFTLDSLITQFKKEIKTK